VCSKIDVGLFLDHSFQLANGRGGKDMKDVAVAVDKAPKSIGHFSFADVVRACGVR